MLSKLFSNFLSYLPWNKKSAVEDFDRERNKRRSDFDVAVYSCEVPSKRARLSENSLNITFNRSLQTELNFRLKNQQPLETIDLTSSDTRFDQKQSKTEAKRSKFLSNIRSSKENFLHRTYCPENKFKTPKHIRSPVKLKNRSRLVASHILGTIDLTDSERSFTRVPLSLMMKQKEKMEETKSEKSPSPLSTSDLSKNPLNGNLSMFNSRQNFTRDQYSLLLKTYAINDASNDGGTSFSSMLVKKFDALKVDKQNEQKEKIEPVNSLRSQFESELRRINQISQLPSKLNSMNEVFLKRKNQLLTQCVGYESRSFTALQDLNAIACTDRLTLNEIVLDDPKEAFLPQLTPQMLEKVKNAFYPHPENEVLVDKFNYKITRKFMQVLTGTTWLNDEVINFYMEMINERSKTKSNYPEVHCFNTFFYTQKKSRGYASVRRWTKKIDIFKKELIIVPIHLDIHWALSLINLKEKTITFYDSMGSSNNTVLAQLMDYIVEEHKDKKQTPLDSSGWTLINKQKNIPQQKNGSDCGVFATMFAEFLSRRAPFTFSQKDMPYFRKKMCYEILTGQLLT